MLVSARFVESWLHATGMHPDDGEPVTEIVESAEARLGYFGSGSRSDPSVELLFRPFGAAYFRAFTHGLRRGLHSFAASRLSAELKSTNIKPHLFTKRESAQNPRRAQILSRVKL